MRASKASARRDDDAKGLAGDRLRQRNLAHGQPVTIGCRQRRFTLAGWVVVKTD